MLEYLYINEEPMRGKQDILLSMGRASDRRLIKKNVGDDYNIIEDQIMAQSSSSYDLCIADLNNFLSNREQLLAAKEEALPAYLPIVLLVQKTAALKRYPEIWEQVDDVIEVPIPIQMLNMRIKNQLRTRDNTLKIAKQNKQLKLLKKAVNSTDLGIIITDAQAEKNPIIFANDGFTELTGYEREEFIGRNCRFLQKDNRDQKGLDDIRQFLHHEKSGRSIVRNYKKDGTPFWNEVSISPISDSEGNATHFIGIQNDVTELVETQKELKDEKKLLRLVTENSTDMISRHSLDGTYLYVTPSCDQLMGYTPDELIGRTAFDFMHPDDLEKVDQAHTILHENPDESETVTTTFRKRTKSGEYKWVETVSRASVNPENNSIIEIQSNTRDISTRKKYEDELKDALEEKNVLLQEIHHRVKNNLAIISGLLQIQQFETDDKQLQKVLSNSVSRIKSMALIHEKLYRSKSLSHIPFREYIEDLIESICESQDSDRKISVETDCDDIVMNINQGVPCALILNEAISNSIEHAFSGIEKGHILVRFKEKDDRIHVTVKDDGIGISQEILDNKQNSMGLTIIETLMRQLNATNEFKTDDGTELSFSFTRQDVKGAHSRFI